MLAFTLHTKKRTYYNMTEYMKSKKTGSIDIKKKGPMFIFKIWHDLDICEISKKYKSIDTIIEPDRYVAYSLKNKEWYDSSNNIIPRNKLKHLFRWFTIDKMVDLLNDEGFSIFSNALKKAIDSADSSDIGNKKSFYSVFELVGYCELTEKYLSQGFTLNHAKIYNVDFCKAVPKNYHQLLKDNRVALQELTYNSLYNDEILNLMEEKKHIKIDTTDVFVHEIRRDLYRQRATFLITLMYTHLIKNGSSNNDAVYLCNRLSNYSGIFYKFASLYYIFNCDIDSLCKYLVYLKDMEDITYNNSIEYLHTYLSAMKTMEVPRRLIDKYPRYLKSVHDVTELKRRRYVKTYPDYLFRTTIKPELEYEYNKKEIVNDVEVVTKFCVVVPKTADDLKKEGSDLNHCVGSYVDKILDGITYVMFLREEKDTSLVTLEFSESTKTIIQARGDGNRSLNENERKYLEIYCKAKKFEISI